MSKLWLTVYWSLMINYWFVQSLILRLYDSDWFLLQWSTFRLLFCFFGSKYSKAVFSGVDFLSVLRSVWWSGSARSPTASPQSPCPSWRWTAGKSSSRFPSPAEALARLRDDPQLLRQRPSPSTPSSRRTPHRWDNVPQFSAHGLSLDV